MILKIHGAVDRTIPRRDSYVITEDHYIDYLTRTDISSHCPGDARGEVRDSHFLFLGYSLRDWNLRVILHRIWGEQARDLQVVGDPARAGRDRAGVLGEADVDILDVPLDEYVARLRRGSRSASRDEP